MRLIKSNRKRLIIFLAVCFSVMAFSYIRTILVVPGQLTLLEGEEYVYNFKSPFMVSIKADNDGVLKLSNIGENIKNRLIKLSGPVLLSTQKNGHVMLTMNIFGIIPLKNVRVDVIENKKIAACGGTIGVKLKINGILVLGTSDVETENGKKVYPARECGIKAGDFIMKVNNKKPECIDDLIDAIDNSMGQKLTMDIKRGNNYIKVHIQPIMAVDDEKYHVGMWVRDNTAGIGTLTFFEPESRLFGALGHGITDIDTGDLMPVEKGELLESNILAIKKGRSGTPGELKGVFIEDRNKLGIINKNCSNGIYGRLNEGALSRLKYRLYSVGLKSQISEGPATILANIGGKKVEEYRIEIQRVYRQTTNGSKGMVIKVTDKRLLDATGGIVQGMSGSPIIQNNRIVGAVTHVLINDPTRGYGIFIENMIKNMSQSNKVGLKHAG
ncbi:MAG TPA: SpoIVB peptidase [Clostridia bacterium]|nr:SpoIVB peptidase [Clostridia bacterium]